MALDAMPASFPGTVHGAQSEELLSGLRAEHKYINPKFFYDERGSRLFSQICELPEYYPTRSEISIFNHHAQSIAASLGKDCAVIEPGAGNCEKIRHLLPAVQPAAYLPLDISREYLLASTADLAPQFPELTILPQVADFNSSLKLPSLIDDHRKILFYPGSTIGNFTPVQAQAFLSRIADTLGPGAGLLIGFDLHKDSAILNAAYNDSQGITESFNRNILHHANTLLNANFAPERFQHLAFYNDTERRIEMHLVSNEFQVVESDGGTLEFGAGEKIHTEFSYKYSIEDFSLLAAEAGFESRQHWQDENNWFAVQYLELSDH
jgi:dimethylhistidine N-methyltransferase